MSVTRRRICAGCAAVVAAAALLLSVVPEAALGARALCNRLFAASEAVNAYAYDRFPVPDDQDATLAALLLAVIGCAVCAGLAASRSAPGALIAALLLSGAQVYFGLSLPAWALLAAYAPLGLVTLRPASAKAALSCAAAALLIAAAVALLWPGVDAPTEAASERTRDQLSRMAQSLSGWTAETPAAQPETRHVNPQTLLAGAQESRQTGAYRLVTVEEEQIAMPRWIDYARIVLLLLLAVALVVLPFAPFAALNARRQRARKARAAFRSEDVSEAICALFRHVAAWLEATGCGAGNLPYRAWADSLNEKLPESYVQRYADCAKLFEEAAYSGHAMREEQREQVRALLDETERLLMARADWRQKFRLRYVECLCDE